MDEPPRQIDLEPNRYRQVNKRDLERTGWQVEPQPVFTRDGPLVLAILFCFGFAFWLFKAEALAVIFWLMGLVWH